MPAQSGPRLLPAFPLPATLFALTLLSVAPACPADEEDYRSGKTYVVETEDGGAFTSEIADADEDSLYFLDGSAMARTEVRTVRRPGEWSEARTLHPGPETADPASARYTGRASWWELFAQLLLGVFR